MGVQGARSSLDDKWKTFVQIDILRRADKSEALDAFLAELVTLPDLFNDLKAQLSGDVNGVPSILTRHFLVDVHEICVASKNEDETNLLLYLSGGRGLIILTVLRLLGVKGLSCSWELSNLFMSIIAAFQSYTANSAVETKFAKALRLSLEQNKATDQYIPLLQLTPAIPPQMSDCFRPADSMAARRPDDGDVSVQRPVEGDAPAGGDYSPSDIRNVLDCVFALLEQLCRNDVSLAPSPTVSAMVLTVVLELLKKIAANRQRPCAAVGADADLGADVDDNGDLGAADTYVVQKMVTLGVSTAISIAQQPTSTGAELRRSGIFEVLSRIVRQQLDLLGHPLTTTTTSPPDAEPEHPAVPPARHARYEILNYLLGCTDLLLACSFAAQNNTTITAIKVHSRILKTFTHFFRQLSGADLLGEALCRLLGGPWSIGFSGELDFTDREELRARYAVLKILWSVGELAAHLRVSRLNAAHMSLAARHGCRHLPGTTGHHHALRRASIADSVETTVQNADTLRFDSSDCPVAVSVRLLLRLLNTGYGWPEATRALLTALGRSGVCCCLDLDGYFAALLDGVFGCEMPSLQERALRLLEGAVAGAATFTVPLDCVVAVCGQCQRRLDGSLEVLNRAMVRMESSGMVYGVWSDPEFVGGFWKIFSRYLDVLTRVDYHRLRLLERHLASVLLTVGVDEVRLELFVRLFVPLLSRLADQTAASTAQHEELTRYCLLTVTSLLDLPYAYRLLVSSRCLDRMFRLMCSWSGTLRQALLGLLVKVMLLETKIEENRTAPVVKTTPLVQDSAGRSETEPKHDEWPDSVSTRRLYRNMVLSHTVWFRNALDPTTARCPAGVEATPDHDHGTGEESVGLLRCLADLWRALCYLVDHSTVSVRWEAHERATIADIVMTLVRHPDNQINDQLSSEPVDADATADRHIDSTTRLRWDLFGSLLHILATSSQHDVTIDGDSYVGFDHFLDTLRSAIISKMADGDCHTLIIGCLFRSLLTAAMVTRLDGSNPKKSSDVVDSRDPVSGEDSSAHSRSPSVGSRSDHSGQGYEGDAEEDDIAGRHWKRPSGLRYDLRPTSARHAHPSAIRCPSILRLALDLAVASYNLAAPGGGRSIANLSDLHRALLEVCDDSLSNRNIVIYEVDTTNHLLTSLRQVLLTSQGELSDLQDSMLGLLAICACRNITAHTLRSFLKLFTSTDAPLLKLHSTLGKIIANLTVMPHACLHFFSAAGGAPRSATRHRRHRSGEVSTVHGSAFLLKTSKIGRDSSTKSGWSASSLAATFPPDPNFVPSFLPPEKGLSVAFWLNVNSNDAFDSSDHTFSQLHLFSCGTDRVLLEVWLQQSPWAFVIKLSSLFQESYRVLVERAIPMPWLKEDAWQHLAVGWRTEHRHPNRYNKCLAVRLVIWLDGMEIWTGVLECSLQRRRPDDGRWVLLLGHSAPDRMQQFSWSLGPLMMFGGTTLDARMTALLFDAGPNCVQLDLPADGHLVQDDGWQELKELLLASFVPQSWAAFTWHPELRQASAASSSLPTVVLGDFADAANHRLDEAVAGVGGAATLVGLFAWTVECCSDEEVQATCLSNLVCMTRKCPNFGRHFRSLAGWDLLVKVLSTSRCTVGARMLAGLMDACTSGDSVLPCRLSESRWRVDRSARVRLVNYELLTKLMENWQMFHRQDQKSVLRLFLKSCLVLLGGETVDWTRLAATDVLERMLMLCRERALDGETQVLSHNAGTVVVDIIRLVAGKCEPEMAVSSLLNFLVLVQPPHQTEICHAKTSFFFLPVRLAARANFRPRKQESYELEATVEMAVQSDCGKNISKKGKIQANEQLKLALESLTISQVSSTDDENVAAAMSDSKDCGDSSVLDDLGLSRSIISDSASMSWESNKPEYEPCDQSIAETSQTSAASISCEFNKTEEEPGDQSLVETSQASAASAASFSFESNKPEDESCDQSIAATSHEPGAVFDGISPAKLDHFSHSDTAEEPQAVEHDNQNHHESTSPSVSTPSVTSPSTNSAATTDLGIICQGVLSILRNLLTTDGDKVFSLLDPRLLTVLALHPEEGVRQSVLHLFHLYVSVSTDKLLSTTTRRCLFGLLANQLYQYEASRTTLEICIAICRGESEFTFDAWRSDGRHFATASVPLILALIPKTCHDYQLCHRFLRMLIGSPQESLHDLFSEGLTQSILISVSLISHNNTISIDNRHRLLANVATLLSNAVLYCVHTSGSAHQGRVRDALRLVSHYELIEAHRCGTDSACLLSFRDLHCSVLYVAIHSILEAFEWDCSYQYRDRLRVTHRHPHQLQTATKLRSSNSDLKMRFAELVSAAVDYICFADVVSEEMSISDYERTFARFLLRVLVDGAQVLVDRRRSHGTVKWYPLVFTTHDCFRSQLGRLLVLFLSPTQQPAQKTFALELLARLPDNGCLLLAFKPSPPLAQRFSSFLHILLRNRESELVDKVAVDQLLTMQVSLGKVLAKVDDVTATNVSDGWLEETIQGKRVWIQTNSNQLNRLLGSLEGAAEMLAETARLIGDAAVGVQNEQRKLYLVHVKRRLNERLAVRRRWKTLVGHLTHERGPWHRPDAYPQSWQLDPTEGPHRVRRRLERCQLTVQPRFLLPEYRDKLAAASHRPPLAYLFERDDVSGDLAAINERIQNTETIICTFPCVIVTPSTEAHGEILFGGHCLYYIGEESYKHSTTVTPTDVVTHTWHLDDIVEVHRRRFQLRDHALELFLGSGRTHLLSLASQGERDALYQQLIESELPNLVAEHENLSMHTSAWRDRAITNFEYLTQLNKAAGRTFNDLMQYPVLPFILADYTSAVLDLQSVHSYRDLTRPMAIQDDSKKQRYVTQYQFLDSEQAAGTHDDFLSPAIGPYHYGSHYSNSGIVLHFLVRLPPFTAMFLEYQDRNFDIPDRTFHSVATSWRLSSSESTTDVKELIPEFFTLPEFLMNSEGFDFGVRQTGDRVSDVTLPTWCRQDPRLFVLVNRQALESSLITERLHGWIDLVFGFKQTGRAAVDAVNVFHPATYYGFDVSQIEDQLRREAMLTMIKTFGQTPRQLFRTAHPMTSLSPTQDHHRAGSAGQVVPVMEEVRGLSWGWYAGSPDAGEPRVVWRRSHARPIRTLVSLITNEVFGLEENQCLLVRYCRSRSANLLNTTYVASAALVLHGFRDGVIRLRLSRDHPAVPLLAADPIDPVTRCVTAPDCPLLFVGKRSGAVSVYRTTFDPQIRLANGDPVELHGHRDAITDIAVSRSYSVAVTASRDCTCIIWDLNRLSYVRTLDDHRHAVQAVTVSDTSGDVASVSDLLPRSSRLALHTINGRLVGSVTTDSSIRSVCFSCAPEGTSVNVVCAGLQDGSVMMWSSWDLKLVRRIELPRPSRPVLCLAYSLDSQHLYAANSDGVVFIWESASDQKIGDPKFRTVI